MTYGNHAINIYDLNADNLNRGLNKREYFAALNMAAILSNAPSATTDPFQLEYLSNCAIAAADALIETLNK